MARVSLKTLEKFRAPNILFVNTYRWYSATSAKERRRRERKTVYEVFSWLDLLKEILNLDIEIKVWNTGVEAYQDNKEIFIFTYSESARYVYKHQKVMPLAKILSEIKTNKYLLEFLKLALAYRPYKGKEMERYQKYKKIVKSLIGEDLEKVKEVLSKWEEIG
ncbi:MAG: hypothetical protein QW067_03240 [Thermofilaceae archaeon]